MSQESSAISGGMLVVLGILVAAGLGYFFYQNYGGSAPSETNISVTTPDNGNSLNEAAPAAGGSESAPATTPAPAGSSNQ